MVYFCFSYLWERVCSIFAFLTYEREFALFLLFLPMREFVLFSSDAEKFCLAHGLRQLTRDVKCDVRILNFRSNATCALPRNTPNDVRRRPLCDVNVTNKRHGE